MKIQLIKLNNNLNRKRIDYNKIQLTFDKSGRRKQQFTVLIKYEDK